MEISRYKKAIAWLLFIANVVLILYLTSQDTESTIQLSEQVRDVVADTAETVGVLDETAWWYNLRNFRRLAHIPEYFLLGITSYCALYVSIKKSRHHRWIVFFGAIGLCLLTSFLDEIYKGMLPTREFDAFDMVFDFIGYSVGNCLAASVEWIVRKTV